MTDDLTFAQLDTSDPAVSEELAALLRQSYTVEAELIGAEDFPPLRRSAEDIRRAPSVFVGCEAEGRLVAIAELEFEGDVVNIAGFVVNPGDFRKGIGSRLLQHVIAASSCRTVTVSTAALNHPAISLYERHGFSISKQWVIDEIEMVTMMRRSE